MKLVYIAQKIEVFVGVITYIINDAWMYSLWYPKDYHQTIMSVYSEDETIYSFQSEQ